jgi:hypothetical protein
VPSGNLHAVQNKYPSLFKLNHNTVRPSSHCAHYAACYCGICSLPVRQPSRYFVADNLFLLATPSLPHSSLRQKSRVCIRHRQGLPNSYRKGNGRNVPKSRINK